MLLDQKPTLSITLLNGKDSWPCESLSMKVKMSFERLSDPLNLTGSTSTGSIKDLTSARTYLYTATCIVCTFVEDSWSILKYYF